MLAWLLISMFQPLSAAVLSLDQPTKVRLGQLKGTVTDAKGLPLPGVTVKLQSTELKTQLTDDKGLYIFKDLPASNYTLTLSLIGYATQTRTISLSDGEIIQNITLVESINSLNDVVVIGYGTQRQSDLTGSISRVSSKEINSTPIVSLDRALQGRVSGVNVTTNSGRPGGSTTIRIRGTGSVNAGNNPLYVVDGFPVTDLNSINPSDIETIDILKDASSTAIYGSRGNNGVVIVTTRKGKAGKSIISYDGYYGGQDVIRKVPLLNARQYADLVNEVQVSAGNPAYFNGSTADRPLPTSLTEGTNWQDEIFKSNAPIQNHQLSVSGGSDQVKYAISAGYYGQDGIVKRSDFNRYSFRANVDGNIKSWLKAGLNLYSSFSNSNSARTEVDGSAGGGVISAALSYSPTFPVYNPDGTYYVSLGTINGLSVDNPMALVNELTDIDRTTRVLGNSFLEFTFSKGLTFKTTFGGDISSSKSNYYATRLAQVGASSNGIASIGNNQIVSWLNENTLNYSKTFASIHSLNAVAGFTNQAWERESFTANASGFNNDFALYNNLGTGATLVAPTSGASQTSLLSFLGRVNYAYNNKYLLTVSGRSDGSSRFGPNRKYGFFPSAAFAWKLGEENFMKTQKVLSDAKIRLSYGLGGNQEIGDYQYVASLSAGRYILNNTLYSSNTNGSVGNEDLRWEKSAQFDMGVDLGFFSNKVRLTADFYRKETSDLLFNVGIPPSSGYASMLQNIGGIKNQGIELELTSSLEAGKFKWEGQLSYSRNRNEVLTLNNLNEFTTGADARLFGASLNPILLKVGSPLGQFYGRVFDGIFQTGDNIAASAQPTAKPGDIRYRDLNGDNVINDTGDRQVIGNSNPKFFGGFNNTFTWNNFDLNIFFQGSYGNDILNISRFDLFSLNGGNNNSAEVLNRWTPTNHSNTIPRANLTGGSRILSSFVVEDGSYLRLKNLSLGYRFPGKILKKAGANSARIYIAAQNLATITNYSGFDPEVNRFGNSTISQGIDYGVYPSAKTLLFGLNFTF
ncbi:SusC/RagA family TonB-linked outer membrane protein [Pedobacter mucosus]|uniref:SusC/RagA family TonB-linked outer membrane protein n=1 Tax=Pedobacter mucosus TaxID=2895286 RepID=UPI001EE42E21|nr:TonB-dependent receptor [Pedobacter mucosus]UKT64934.1 TonB-dependent receptor [Pedobacter mucosus]